MYFLLSAPVLLPNTNGEIVTEEANEEAKTEDDANEDEEAGAEGVTRDAASSDVA